MDKLGEISILNRQNVFHERLLKLSNTDKIMLLRSRRRNVGAKETQMNLYVGEAGYMKMF